MIWPAIAAVGLLAIADVALVIRLHSMNRELQASFAREQSVIDTSRGLVATLNGTTANLERQNAVVEELLAEKRAAWGLGRR